MTDRLGPPILEPRADVAAIIAEALGLGALAVVHLLARDPLPGEVLSVIRDAVSARSLYRKIVALVGNPKVVLEWAGDCPLSLDQCPCSGQRLARDPTPPPCEHLEWHVMNRSDRDPPCKKMMYGGWFRYVTSRTVDGPHYLENPAEVPLVPTRRGRPRRPA